jgi:hypothetical protein
VPKNGFTVTVKGTTGVTTDIITDAEIGVNNQNTIELTLTTAPTSGQIVTVAYNKDTNMLNNVKSTNGLYLNSIPTMNVTNN